VYVEEVAEAIARILAAPPSSPVEDILLTYI
jgi:hypothetical protein